MVNQPKRAREQREMVETSHVALMVVEQIAKEIANRAVEESEFMAHIKR
jgi:hypothetical protein